MVKKMEASEKLTIQALKAHDKVHPKFKTAGKSLKQKSRASLLSSPEEPSEVIYFCLVNHKIEKKIKVALNLSETLPKKKNPNCKRLEISICYNLYLSTFLSFH